MKILNKINIFFKFIGLVLSVLFFIASVSNSDFKFFKHFPKVIFGIDIKGGNELILKIDSDQYIKSRYENLLLNIDFDKHKLRHQIKNQILEIESSNNEEIKNIILTKNKNIIIQNLSNNKIIISFSKDEINDMNFNLFKNTIHILKNRIDGLGAKEISITRYGRDKIAIKMPQDISMNKIKDIINQRGNLSFHKINFKDLHKKNIKHPKLINSDIQIPVENAILNGEYITDAKVVNDGIKFVVLFTLDKTGSELFAKITKNNIGNHLAIILDNKILSIPTINEAILNGSCMISGNFTFEEASKFALLLKSGSFSVPIEILEERTISSLFDKEIIDSTKLALFISMFLILIVIVFLYRILGLVSWLALVFNLIFLVDFFALFGFTLTIGGISGIILTLGMAIDANVLVYEKIKEIRNNPKYINRFEIEQGFNNALSIIIDANFTTLLAAFCMFIFGNSFLKNFSITLILGILISLFTSIFLTKYILFAISKKRNIRF